MKHCTQHGHIKHLETDNFCNPDLSLAQNRLPEGRSTFWIMYYEMCGDLVGGHSSIVARSTLSAKLAWH
jgi:hypothetical protein